MPKWVGPVGPTRFAASTLIQLTNSHHHLCNHGPPSSHHIQQAHLLLSSIRPSTACCTMREPVCMPRESTSNTRKPLCQSHPISEPRPTMNHCAPIVFSAHCRVSGRSSLITTLQAASIHYNPFRAFYFVLVKVVWVGPTSLIKETCARGIKFMFGPSQYLVWGAHVVFLLVGF